MIKFKSTNSLTGKIFVSSAVVMAIGLFMKVAGYAEKRMLGHVFGADDHLDTYLTAVKISAMGYLLIRGMMRPVITPLLTTLKNRSLAEARNYGISLALVAGGLLMAMTAGWIVFAPALVRYAAPGFEPEKQAECVRLTRWLMGPSTLMAVGYLMSISLQVRKRFSIAATGEFLQKCGLLLGILFLAAPLGFNGLLVANWMGVLVFVSYFAFSHARFLHAAEPFEFSRAPMRETLWLALPIILGSLVSYWGKLLQTSFASDLSSGSVTALGFAQMTTDLPLNLLPLSLSIVLLPYFSEFSDRKEYERSVQYLGKAVRFLLLVFVPIGLCLYLFRMPIAHILFKSGRFDQNDLDLTAHAMTGLAWGLPFFAIEIVIMNFFYASRRMIAPLVCGMVATGMAMAALPWLSARFGLAGISAYLSLGRMIKIALLTGCLHRMKVRLSFRPTLAFSLKLAGALLLAKLVHTGIQAYLPPGPWGWGKLPIMAISMGLTMAGFFAAAFLLGLEECRWAVRALINRGRVPVDLNGANNQSDCASACASNRHAVLTKE